jgi:hypothetical protein
MVSFQKKVHKQLAELVFMFHDDCSHGEYTTVGKSNEGEEGEEEIFFEEKVAVLLKDENIFPSKCPTLFALLGGRKEVAAQQLQDMFCELLAHFGKGNTVDFVHENGNRHEQLSSHKCRIRRAFCSKLESSNGSKASWNI